MQYVSNRETKSFKNQIFAIICLEVGNYQKIVVSSSVSSLEFFCFWFEFEKFVEYGRSKSMAIYNNPWHFAFFFCK